MRIQALIFDFDGVLVDTEPLHHASFAEVLAPCGLQISWTDYLAEYIGFDDRDVLQTVFRRAGRVLDREDMGRLIQAKAGIFARLASAEALSPLPGSVELVRAAEGRIPLGLCSGALRVDIDPILVRLGLTDVFDAVVTAESVAASKPDPEGYRYTVRLLEKAFGKRLDPEGVIAIEDTPTGIEAAKGAGLRVLGVASTHELNALDQADWRVSSLSGLHVDHLSDRLGERV